MWPSMDSYPFAHTSPIWINFVGSTEPNAKRVATEELTFAINELKNIAQERYKGENITALLEQFERAQGLTKKLACLLVKSSSWIQCNKRTENHQKYSTCNHCHI